MTEPQAGPRSRLRRLVRRVFGERPRDLLLAFAPPLLAVVIDLVLRPGALAAYALQGKAIYASAILIDALLWALPLWCAGWLLARSTRKARAALVALGVFTLLVTTFGTAGQVLYFRVFHAYMGRDTLRLGIALRGTVRDWFDAWGGPWLMAGMLLAGLVVTAAWLRVARAMRRSTSGPFPWALAVAFPLALGLFWFDAVDSRFLQAATPDVCFVHGVVHAARMALTGQWSRRQGVSLRTPAPLPQLVSSRPRPRNVVLIITESVRADATCSDPPPACRSEFLDDVAGDRMSLGRLTSQTPNTFSASVILWSGVVPNADFRSAHSAPLLWELARALGYRTAYLSSQNPDYEDFGVFTRNAGIDVQVTANDLGGMGQEQLGAPDERATAAAIDFVHSVPQGTPFFAVVHLSNTHMPYRIDPALTPYLPQSSDPLSNVSAFHNRYRNSVRMQERTVASLVRALRDSPAWDDTAVVFVSDHGEQFREHGGLYHNHSLFDEEVRVPGWITGGAEALGPIERGMLSTYAGRRTYMQDVHETIVDLLGLEESRASLPLASLVTGRSLLRLRGDEPAMLLATSTSVWEPDDARFGVMRSNRLVFGGPTGAWACYDLDKDPGEHSPRAPDWCPELLAIARREFAGVATPK